MMRYKEEKSLLVSEMKTLLRFYHRFTLPLLSDDIIGMYCVSSIYVHAMYIHSSMPQSQSETYVHTYIHTYIYWYIYILH